MADSQSFIGESRHKVDTKGRVSIPAAFRRVLEAGDPDWDPDSKQNALPTVVIVYGDHRREYLECYTVQEMARVHAKIRRMKRGTPRRRLMERLFSTQSMVTTLDENGRIVLSPKLREKIKLSGEAQFAGTVDTFQIWQPEAYEADLAAMEDEVDDFDGDLLMMLDDDDEDEEI